MKKYITQIITAVSQVFSRLLYWLIAFSVALIIILITVLLSQFRFIISVLDSSFFDTPTKLKAIVSSFGAFQTNLMIEDQIFTVIIAILSGITMAMVVYYFKYRFSVHAAAGTSFLGVVVGLLGVGCSACGSVVVSTIFGVGATGIFLGVFPFEGTEISVLSVVILLGSLYVIARKIASPKMCDIKSSSS